MKTFFEDGDLLASLLASMKSSPTFLPYASELNFELHYSPSSQSFTVRLLLNWVEQPLGGPCGGETRCEYTDFIQWVKSVSFVGDDEQLVSLCGQTPTQRFYSRVNDFYNTLDEAKTVKKN
jgi:hypothetical protein